MYCLSLQAWGAILRARFSQIMSSTFFCGATCEAYHELKHIGVLEFLRKQNGIN